MPMDPERWKQIDELLQAAVRVPVEQQDEFLRRECPGDAELFEEVHSLLISYRQAGSFLESPAFSPADMPTQTSGPALIGVTFRSLVGETVSHYRVLSRLGSGGMGVVYEAEDINLGRRVAMKFLPGEVASDRTAFDRMQREARSASALDHPNICSVYELGEHEGQPFIVMQLLEGETLRQWIERSSKMDSHSRLKGAIDLALQITRGLEAAHQKNIIHRDIKPDNIFVTVRGEVKILDFGLAKLIEPQKESGVPSDLTADTATYQDETSTLTRTGTRMGTAFYMSPEQIRGEKLDARSDLFSLGLVLFEMLTARRAFKGGTGADVHDAVLHGSPVPVRQLNPAVPSGFESVIKRSLERDRDCRYQSAKELHTDLERLKLRRSPALIIGAGIAAGLLLLSLIVLAANVGGLRDRILRHPASNEAARQLRQRTAVAVLGFKNLSGRDDEAWISTALSEMLDAQLSAGQELRVISSEDVARMKIDLSLPAADSYSRNTLKKIRTNLGSDIVVLGSYLDTGKDGGGKIRVDVRLQDATEGETIAVISQDGNEASLPELVTQSGAGLRRKLGIADVSSSEASQVAASAPASPEATRLYAEGLAKLQAYEALAARDLLEQAVAADPNYALSHAALAEAWSQLGYDKKAEEEAKKAFGLSANLTREQHLSVEGRYREFAHDFSSAIEIYRTLRNFFPDNLEYALRLASSQRKAGRPGDSLGTIAQVRTLPKPLSDDARIDVEEASAQNQAGNFSALEKTAAAAAAKAKAQGSRMLQVQAIDAEAFAWDRLGDLNKAVQKSIESRDLATKAGNPHVLGQVLRTYGIVLYDKGDFAGAQSAYEQALNIFQKIGDGQIGATSVSLGNIYYDQGKLEEARRYYEQALRTDQEIDAGPAEIGSDLGSIANVIDNLGDLVGATRMQERSLQGFRDGGAQRGVTATLGNLAGILVERGDLSQAMSNYEEGISLAEKIGYKDGRAFNLQGEAQVFLAWDRLSQARDRAEQALGLDKEVGDSVQVAQSQMALANIALEQGKPAEAEALLRAAAPQFEQHSMATGASQSAALLARTLLAQSKMEEAQVAASNALALAQRTSDRSTHLMANLAVAEVNARTGKEPAATKALQSILSECLRDGYKEFEFEARLDLGRLELRSSRASGRQRLEKLKEDASREDFRLIARKAREELSPGPKHAAYPEPQTHAHVALKEGALTLSFPGAIMRVGSGLQSGVNRAK
jgi:serine/threonine protein kinase/Tfp pilus assembly protein PilF